MRTKLILAMLVVMLGANVSSAYDDGDFQYWTAVSGTTKINDEWKFKAEEEFKYGDNASDFYYQHTDLSLIYSGAADWLTLGFNYRAAFEKSGDDWRFENRPHFNATFKTKWKDVGLSNRSRLEMRIRDTKEDKPRYRNKSTIKLPLKMSKFEIQPYLADELFFEFEGTELTKNRFYSGFSVKFAKNIKGDIHYILERGKTSGGWKNTNVLGTKLKISF